MPFLLLALLWLSPAQAQSPPRDVVAEVPAARSTAARPVRAMRAPRVSAAALASARLFLCPHGGTPQGRGRCTRARGGSGAGFLGDDPAVRDWDQGLRPPTRAQLPCPPGTIGVPARDQPNVTRCVAG